MDATDPQAPISFDTPTPAKLLAVESPALLKSLCLILCASLCGLAAVVIVMCGNFLEAFATLYSELPVATRAVLIGRYCWLLIPVLGGVMAYQIVRHARKGPIPRKHLLALIALVIVSVLLAAGVVALLYWPIYRFGQIV
jgi:hypothetical protein